MCAQRSLKSACAFAQSDQSLRCPHEETLHVWLWKMRPVKILIRLCECTAWSEYSLCAHFRRYIYRRCGSLSDVVTHSDIVVHYSTLRIIIWRCGSFSDVAAHLYSDGFLQFVSVLFYQIFPNTVATNLQQQEIYDLFLLFSSLR